MAIPSGSAGSTNPWSFVELGKNLARKNDYEPAICAFTAAIQSANLIIQLYYEAHYERGLAYFDAKKYDEAIRDFDQIVHKSDRFRKLYEDNSHSEKCKKLIFENIVRLINMARSSLIDSYMERGKSHASRAECALAIEDFTQAIQLDPSNFHAFCRRGLAYRELAEWDKADDDFQMASRLDPRGFESLQPFWVALHYRIAHPTLPDTRLRPTFRDRIAATS